MKTRKSTCGLCKPHKKWRQNKTRRERSLEKALQEDDLTPDLIKATEKKFG